MTVVSLVKFVGRFEVKSDSYSQAVIKIINNIKKKYPNLETRIKKLKNEEEVFEFITDWVNWNHKRGLSPRSIRTYFGIMNQMLYYFGHKLTELDIKMNIKFPKKLTEEKYGLTSDDIEKILAKSNYKKKALYLALLSSGMRVGEVVQIKKKHLDLSKERVMVKIPPQFTKTKTGRTTFLSNEAWGMISSIFHNLNDNDNVWSRTDTIGEGQAFRTCVDAIGLTERYETTKIRKITLHSFRAYFITKVSRYDANFAKRLAGQKGYLDEYDRLSEDEKLKIYLNVEPALIIDSTERDKIKMEKQQKEISELQKSNLQNKTLEIRLGKVEEESNQSTDLLNTLLQITAGKDMGATDKQIDDVWKNEFIPKFNKFLQLQQVIKEAKSKSAF